MIDSMTGFGRGEASSNGIAVTAEAKSVNSRYLDISFRMPQEIQEKELALKELIQSKISRGNINLSIRINKAETGKPQVAINPKLAKGYKKILDDLRTAVEIEAPVSLKDLIKFDEIFVAPEKSDELVEAIWTISKKATKQALDQLAEMRAQEGQQLEDDLLGRAHDIEQKMKKIQSLSDGRAEEARDRLLERIQKLVDDDNLDEERLDMEVAILVDKMDITEEVVRLTSHIKFFKEALKSNEPVGRRLKFLSQEMNREINTIGSKANSSEISQHVVHAKESLEQIREQVLNVE